MYRKVPLFLALTMLSNLAIADVYKCQDENGRDVFSATPCAMDSAAEAAATPPQLSSNSRLASDAQNEAYTKELKPLQSPDAGTQACFNYTNTTAHFPDPSATKLLSSSKKWVSVQDVGGRQMVTIGVTSKNEAGMYVGIQMFNCLLMGDNVTVNTGAYELVPD